MATTVKPQYTIQEEQGKPQVHQQEAAELEKQPGPIMNPVLGMFVFLALVVASNLALDGINYLIDHMLGH